MPHFHRGTTNRIYFLYCDVVHISTTFTPNPEQNIKMFHSFQINFNGIALTEYLKSLPDFIDNVMLHTSLEINDKHGFKNVYMF